MLKKHLLLQLTATLRTGGVTKGKLHISAVISGARPMFPSSDAAEADRSCNAGLITGMRSRVIYPSLFIQYDENLSQTCSELV